MRRFFVEDMEKDSRHIEIKGAEFSHLKNVLRLKQGDAVICLNGRGFEFIGHIESILKNSAKVKTDTVRENKTESPLSLTLLQGLVKGDKPEFIVQKATELGAKEIIFYTTERTVPKFSEEKAGKRLERLRKVSIESLKQSERGFLPEIGFMDFKNAIDSFRDKELKIIFYEDERKRHLRDVLKWHKEAKEAAVMVGPEGGFSGEEKDEAIRAGFIVAGLGPRRLRAETAAITVISILQYELGDAG